PGGRGSPGATGTRDRSAAFARAMGPPGEHLRQDGSCSAEAGASDARGSGELGSAHPDRPAEHLVACGDRGDPAADAWWSPAARAFCYAGFFPPAGDRAVHHGLPGARLPALPGAQAARDLRLRRLPGAHRDPHPGEEKEALAEATSRVSAARAPRLRCGAEALPRWWQRGRPRGNRTNEGRGSATAW